MSNNLNERNLSRRNFLYNTSILAAGVPFIKLARFDWKSNPIEIVRNTPQVLVTDPRMNLSFGEERMILNDGLQPSMLCTKSGTLIVQSQISKKPYPQKRIFYPYAMSTVISRDGGKEWKEFTLLNTTILTA